MDAAQGSGSDGPQLDLPAGEPILIGLSGGPDSTGLAVWATRTYPDLDWHLVHVRHGLRDDHADARAAREIAEILRRPIHIEAANWTAISPGQRHEAVARQVRYAAYVRVATRIQARHILLGHSVEDQAETVLLRLVRGSGPRGMAAMAKRVQRGPLTIHRPLLDWEKARIHTYSQGFPTIEDPTNTDLHQRRSYLRFEVIPRLAQARPDGQPVSQAIARFARLQGQEQALLDLLLAPYRGPAWGALRRIRADVDPRIVQRLIFEALGYAVEEALVRRIVQLEPGQRADLPGRRVAARDSYGWVIGPREQSWTFAILDYHLNDPNTDGEGGRRQPPPWPPGDPMVAFSVPFIVDLPASVHPATVRIRFREPQDRPFKRIFARFPASLRGHLPILETEKGEILAIGPYQAPTIELSHDTPIRYGLFPR